MHWIKKIHKWASVIVGIQFLLWLLSGIYYNLMDSSKAYGHTYKNQALVKLEWVTNIIRPITIKIYIDDDNRSISTSP